MKLALTLFGLDAFLLHVYFSDQEQVLNLLGFVNSGISIIMFGSPLVNVVQVLKLKSYKGIISLPMAIAGLLVSALWVLLGLQMNDLFVIVPNGGGAILSGIQVLVCLYYRNSTGFLPVKNETTDF